MVKNASAKPKNLGGRPPAFDRKAVISAAVFAFWSKGFNATTLTDLEDATGVDRSSLYKSFGGKNGLYESAAAAYLAVADEQLFHPLHHGTDGIIDILEFIDILSNSYRSDSPKGCFIVNDMATVANFDPTQRYLERLEGGFRAALERASTKGQIDTQTVEQRRQFLTAAFIGINLVHRHATDPTAAYTLIDGVRAEVNSWASPDQP